MTKKKTPVIKTETQGDRLRAARLQAGLSQEQAAAKIGCKQEQLSRIERGKPASLDWLHAAAIAMNVDPHDIDARLTSTKVPDHASTTELRDGGKPRS